MSERERAIAIIEEAYAGWGDEAALVDAIEEALRSVREEERRRCAEIAGRAEIYDSLGGPVGIVGFPVSREQAILNVRSSIVALILAPSEKAGDRDRPVRDAPGAQPGPRPSSRREGI